MGIIDEAITKSKEMLNTKESGRVKTFLQNFTAKLQQFNANNFKVAGLALATLMIGLASMTVVNYAAESVNIYQQAASLNNSLVGFGNTASTANSSDPSAQAIVGKGHKKVAIAENKTTNNTITDKDDITPPPTPPAEEQTTVSLIDRLTSAIANIVALN